ncbi:glutamine amidotransferase [Dethiosulfatibacter aminovorans DSM 17477]|uniref:Imidazole glycerol phosphate synthase subunit HisH n=1 Tax=Dethiosulfatibacter aminovorans DSM 17477 TaxID=1121476 RepID=A0A1M6H3V2_9FIRM|nr:imidazole glycerol phosphate synthase subunit HisH [Dethiosulfatibacter aminovorans]SHJ16822.1 glutamine amidotransferase [Dethiosulfatibacter aminovorans DSM 17477]
MNVMIDYGMGNLNSAQKGFERVGLDIVVSDSVQKIRDARTLILPGVGAYRDAMALLDKLELSEVIKEEVRNGKPIIGICLGMQLLYDKSYEYGEYEGLGLIEGEIKKMEVSLKVPHMGWNSLNFKDKDNKILKYINEGEYVYYVHSYYADSDNSELVAYSDYEIMIPGIVNKDNIYGIQFHPEKSGMVGHNILKAYKEIIE